MNEKIKKVYIIGDSHIDAIKRACKLHSFPGKNIEYSINRISKIKNDVEIGDVSMEDSLKIVSKLNSEDIVVSVIGGNQHQTVGLIQHPIPFNYYEPSDRSFRPLDGEYCIPYRMIWDLFETGIRGRDGDRIQKIRNAAQCEVMHLAAPPPKQDESHIRSRHETYFVKNGLLDKGISPAHLRLKLWKLQCQVLKQLCEEWDVKYLPVPAECLTSDGFLKPEYYARDATHGNESYGKLVLEQIEKYVNSK